MKHKDVYDRLIPEENEQQLINHFKTKIQEVMNLKPKK